VFQRPARVKRSKGRSEPGAAKQRQRADDFQDPHREAAEEYEQSRCELEHGAA